MYRLNFAVVVAVVVVEVDLNLMYLVGIDSYQLNLYMRLKKDVAVVAVAAEIVFVEQLIVEKEEVFEKRMLVSLLDLVRMHLINLN